MAVCKTGTYAKLAHLPEDEALHAHCARLFTLVGSLILQPFFVGTGLPQAFLSPVLL